MKVLFLDIDGVCNSAEYAKSRPKGGLLGIDPKLAKKVRRVIKETGCEVVLSSTWRLYDKSRHDVRRDVCGFLDVTPNFQAGAQNGRTERGYEVQDWLDRHPDVEVYAILDDDSDFLEDQWLFKTTFKLGITDEIAAKVIAHLNSVDE